jgi:cell wall-associated NlpC family hydrolase
VAAQRRKLDEALAALEADKRLVQAKLSAAKAELSRLTAKQRAALQRASRAAAERSLSEAVGKKVSPGASCDDVGISASSGRVQKVLDYACAQLGDPYRWGADGPDSFDCSGLTQRAWAQAGVSLPHNAEMQARYGRRVKAADLQPGDLVFYHSPISHVGIYVGNKLMLHAPRTGEVVKIAAVRYGDLVAAVRL